jgi:hypothetical protein
MRAEGWYLAVHDSTSPEYCLTRLLAFGLTAVVFLVLGIVVERGLAFFGLFSLATVLLWWKRWRHALRNATRERG